jgi:hypothetical protein
MELDPRAIAVQGLGFDELLVAVQGLLGTDGGEPEPPVYPRMARVRKPKRRKDDDDVLLFML